MDYVTKSHRHAMSIIESNNNYLEIYNELKDAILSISDSDLKEDFYRRGLKRQKSLTKPINKLIKDNLLKYEWHSEAKIFQPPEFAHPWRLDFAKGPFSVEVAFNHGEATAWNFMKPVIASEINHVKTALDTEIGIVVLATEDLKLNGAFDGTPTTFESIDKFLTPLNSYLTVPILIIGLNGPKSFKVIPHQDPRVTTGRKLIGLIKDNSTDQYSVLDDEKHLWKDLN